MFYRQEFCCGLPWIALWFYWGAERLLLGSQVDDFLLCDIWQQWTGWSCFSGSRIPQLFDPYSIPRFLPGMGHPSDFLHETSLLPVLSGGWQHTCQDFILSKICGEETSMMSSGIWWSVDLVLWTWLFKITAVPHKSFVHTVEHATIILVSLPTFYLPFGVPSVVRSDSFLSDNWPSTSKHL